MINKQITEYLDHSIPKSPLFALGFKNAQGFALLILLSVILTPLAKANAQTTSVKTAHAFDSRNLSFMDLSREQGLSQNAGNAIVQDNQGYIWFGTQEGLNRYDGYKIQVFEHDNTDPTSLSNDWVWSLIVDNAGVIWVGTDGGGLNRFNAEKNTFTSFRHNPEDNNTITHDRVRVIYQDYQDNYWVGTDGGGLNRFDAETGQFVHFQHDPEDPKTLPNNTVLSILEDRSGNLWVGTNGGGLAKMDRGTGTFVTYRHDPSSPSTLD